MTSPNEEDAAAAARVSELVAKARSYETTDPEVALGQARKAVEAIARTVFQREIGEPGKQMLDTMLQKLVAQKLIPPSIQVPFGTIQAYGNFGVHAQSDARTIDASYAAPAFAALSAVEAWFFREYLKQPLSPAAVPAAKVVPLARPRRWWIPAAIGGVVLVAGAGALVMTMGGRKVDPPPPVVPRVQPVAVATPPSENAPPGMVHIAAANFQMGTTDDERERDLARCARECNFYRTAAKLEQVREVNLHAFDLDATEVRVKDFVLWLESQPPATGITYPGVRSDHGRYLPGPGADELPIAAVSWDEAAQYCADHGKTLPTEAQWELAARGEGRRSMPWGDALPKDCSDVVYARDPHLSCARLGGHPAPVGTAPGDVTPQGVHDLGGNVSEWVLDAEGDRPACGSACVDPARSDPHAGKHAVRGGNWSEGELSLRAAMLTFTTNGNRLPTVGFRCAK